MGERVREGQAGNNPVVEASERDLLAVAATHAVSWAQPAAPDADAAAGALPLQPRHPSRLQQASQLLAGHQINARSVLAAIEAELDRGAAFLLVPVFLAFGALVYFTLPTEPDLAPLVAAFALPALLASLRRTHRLSHYTLAAVAAGMLGMVVAKFETERMATKMLGAEISTALTGRVVEIDHLDNGRVRLTLDVLATARPVLRYAPERVRLTARKLPEGVQAGSEVTGYARLMPPSGPVRPGSYDFSFESFFDGIGASGFFMKGPELAVATQPLSVSDRASASVENVREKIAQRIRERIGGPEGEIAAALVVGVRGGIPEDVNEALRRTGLYHIISISGLHMAMVAGTVMLLMRLSFAAFPNFSSHWPVKKVAAGAALVSTGGYLFISGAEVAAQRSFIMLAVMLVAVLFDRAALTMRNLAISAIVVIIISPHEVVGPSFQMSFAATAALVGAYAWWSDRREEQAPPTGQRSLPSKIWRWLATVTLGLVATSLIAGIATSVFGAWHFQRVSPLSLVANLAVMPFVSVLVMPFAVVAGIFMPLGLDGIFLDTMGLGLKAMIALAMWFSERSPVDAVGLVSTHAVVLVTAALIIASMATTWLRVAALPLAALGVLTVVETKTPDVLVSEDGRLVGVPVGDGRLAVNRARPNQFTVDNWKRAVVSEEIVSPARIAPDSPTKAGSSLNLGGVSPPTSLGSFACGNGVCIVGQSAGAQIAHAENADSARRACASAKLVIVNDATAKDICPNSAAAVLTSRELARLGSAAIFLTPMSDSARPKVEIRHALTEPYRPWHAQRAFSREARGLPPYKRADKRPKPPYAATPSQ
ncbi:ComEC/Rec2 family competence protein [Aminobacter anthyllidis]|uniref:ComEC/Rec2 family competence protein n=1 Tax=Aminobacter anthyllidis TaxID=1035067 RepID=A0A9X1A7Q1_9HYPH|nr:ComEC/Rec2 family competence protein [Aminobacter anthyllidis]MBT1154838.1 ComEC/Rec2 family competence protein [Aminobacter anthyllidis]